MGGCGGVRHGGGGVMVRRGVWVLDRRAGHPRRVVVHAGDAGGAANGHRLAVRRGLK